MGERAMSQFDDGNPANDSTAALGWLGHGPLGPPSLSPDKRNWQNVYYALRTGNANPATINAEIARRAAAAGTAGLGEDSRLAQYAARASQVIASQRRRIQALEARLSRAG